MSVLQAMSDSSEHKCYGEDGTFEGSYTTNSPLARAIQEAPEFKEILKLLGDLRLETLNLEKAELEKAQLCKTDREIELEQVIKDQTFDMRGPVGQKWARNLKGDDKMRDEYKLIKTPEERKKYRLDWVARQLNNIKIGKLHTQSYKKALIKWIRRECKDPAIEAPTEPVTQGLATAHHSHFPRHYEGVDCDSFEWSVWWCTRCGLCAESAMKGLARPCKGVLSQAGRQNVRRIERGLMPGSSERAQKNNRASPAFKEKPRKKKAGKAARA